MARRWDGRWPAASGQRPASSGLALLMTERGSDEGGGASSEEKKEMLSPVHFELLAAQPLDFRGDARRLALTCRGKIC